MQDNRHPFIRQRAGGGDDVVDMSMHPAIRHQPHQMRGAAGFLHPGDEILQGGIAAKAAILDRKVDLSQVHRHHAPRADIGMPDLGIAHLPGRQAHIRPVGNQRGMGAGGHQAVEMRGIGQHRRVGLLAFRQAPAVENAQDNGFGAAHDLLLPGCGRSNASRRRGEEQKIAAPDSAWDRSSGKRRGCRRAALRPPCA